MLCVFGCLSSMCYESNYGNIITIGHGLEQHWRETGTETGMKNGITLGPKCWVPAERFCVRVFLEFVYPEGAQLDRVSSAAAVPVGKCSRWHPEPLLPLSVQGLWLTTHTHTQTPVPGLSLPAQDGMQISKPMRHPAPPGSQADHTVGRMVTIRLPV